eukprot:GILK01008287.1.p1 GENE.GILK01008287.1~~GILK01008287.1.p1  ORF type:complete len:512 (-),score=72.60 GILK01008287.1:61-1560(-)
MEPILMDPKLFDEVCSIVWPRNVKQEDVMRWYGTRFVFSDAPQTRFGLIQTHGGPCGVLAAVQAHLIHLLCQQNKLETCSDDDRESALVHALCLILDRARPTATSPLSVVFFAPGATIQSEALIGASDLTIHSTRSVGELQQLLSTNLVSLHASGAVYLFLLSVVLTRSLRELKDDMDDPNNTLTVEFGHSGQELLNLLLTGRAVSNVFDGTKQLDGEASLMLKGIESRSSVGYLSHLEFLRYLEVGNNYKLPLQPVWVIGSASHFTVLFSKDPAVLELIPVESVRTKARKVFSTVDRDENGFVTSDRLVEMLRHPDLGLEQPLSHDQIQSLQVQLDMDGIVLWEQFVSAIESLVNGSSAQRQPSALPAAQTYPPVPWPCEVCTYINENTQSNSCEMCTAARPKPDSATAGQTEPESASTSFELFHYNGLAGPDGNPRLTRLMVSIRLSDEATRNEAYNASSGHMSHQAHTNPPIVEVLRTKWSTAQVAWEGAEVPRID